MKYMFATFSHRAFNRAGNNAAIRAGSKAKGYFSVAFLLCLSSILLSRPVVAKTPSALGVDKVAFAASSQNAAKSKVSAKKAGAQQQKIDLNSASADEIAKTLSGVGPRKAQAMVKYRNEVGPFRSTDEVLEVKGFGPSILTRNKGRILPGKVSPKR
jgi:competence protein ComEA